MREVRLVVAKEKCRRGMNAFMLFGCGHGIFNILHIVATVTQLLCAFLISRVFSTSIRSCLYLFVLFFRGAHSHLYLLFWLCAVFLKQFLHSTWNGCYLCTVHCAHIFRFVKQIEWMRFFILLLSVCFGVRLYLECNRVTLFGVYRAIPAFLFRV